MSRQALPRHNPGSTASGARRPFDGNFELASTPALATFGESFAVPAASRTSQSSVPSTAGGRCGAAKKSAQ
jgi:hypothetical protein